MKEIRNTKLFLELQENPTWDTLWDVTYPEYPELKDRRIPEFFGGLDHIDVKPKGVYFYDVGCNGKDNSFVIRCK